MPPALVCLRINVSMCCTRARPLRAWPPNANGVVVAHSCKLLRVRRAPGHSIDRAGMAAEHTHKLRGMPVPDVHARICRFRSGITREHARTTASNAASKCRADVKGEISHDCGQN